MVRQPVSTINAAPDHRNVDGQPVHDDGGQHDGHDRQGQGRLVFRGGSWAASVSTRKSGSSPSRFSLSHGPSTAARRQTAGPCRAGRRGRRGPCADGQHAQSVLVAEMDLAQRHVRQHGVGGEHHLHQARVDTSMDRSVCGASASMNMPSRPCMSRMEIMSAVPQTAKNRSPAAKRSSDAERRGGASPRRMQRI